MVAQRLGVAAEHVDDNLLLGGGGPVDANDLRTQGDLCLSIALASGDANYQCASTADALRFLRQLIVVLDKASRDADCVSHQLPPRLDTHTQRELQRLAEADHPAPLIFRLLVGIACVNNFRCFVAEHSDPELFAVFVDYLTEALCHLLMGTRFDQQPVRRADEAEFVSLAAFTHRMAVAYVGQCFPRGSAAGRRYAAPRQA